MSKKFGKAVLMTVLCGAMMFCGTMTAYAGGGEDADEPMTEPIYTPVIEQETEEEDKEPAAFTPDGNAELVDEATDEDEKLFCTFVTKNDNYFYLVIDKARENDNVYMLNLIDEQDLMALIAEQEGTETAGTSGEKGNDISLKPEAGITETPEPAETVPKEDEPVETEPQKNTSGITILLVFLLLGGGAGAYYYLKFVKGKKEDFKLEDDLDFYDDEDYVNEDETEDATEPDASDDEVGENEEDI